MFNIQLQPETITDEHTREDENVARQVAMLIFHHESMWEDWTHPNFSMPCNDMEVRNET